MPNLYVGPTDDPFFIFKTMPLLVYRCNFSALLKCGAITRWAIFSFTASVRAFFEVKINSTLKILVNLSQAKRHNKCFSVPDFCHF